MEVGGVATRYIFGVIVLLWVVNCVKCLEKAGPEGLSHDYELQLAKAVAQAKCRENEILPIWDTKKKLMKPSGCDSKACQECNKTAAALKSTEILDTFRTEGYYNGSIAPRPVFHCVEYKGQGLEDCWGEAFFRLQYETHPPNSSELIPLMFLVEKQVGNQTTVLVRQVHWLFGFCIQDALPHRIRVTAISSKHVFAPILSDVVHIPPSVGATKRKIPPPKNLSVLNMAVNPLSASRDPQVTIRWESDSGLNASCHYKVDYMDDELQKTVYRKKADDAFWMDLTELKFGQTYKVLVSEQSLLFSESKAAVLKFSVPSCLDFPNYNKSFCAPPHPETLQVGNETETSFWIRWDPPKNYSVEKYDLLVDRYSITPFDMHKGHIFRGSVWGNVTSKEIVTNGTVKGPIRISITASAHGQTSPELWTIQHLKGADVGRKWGKLYWIGGVFVLVASVGVCYFGKRFQEKRLRKREKKKKQIEVSVSCRVPGSDVMIMGESDLQKWEVLPKPQVNRYSSKWDIEYESLIIGEVIGIGNFGQVRKAELHRNRTRTTVAVKTLRDGSDSTNSEKFREEFDILQGLEPNMNIVGLVGIVKEPIRALVVEYCDAGDLRTHLKKALETQTEKQRGTPMMNSSVHLSTADTVRVQLDMVTNESYFLNEPETVVTVTLQDLMSYSWQIACGMEFLSGNKIVHRDLAARNILICGESRTLKIADFGLSRDVYEHNYYKNKTNVMMPIKWLAVECLLQDLYTTKSDVWSFGVVLYEIFTFGGNPYPGIHNSSVFDYIKSGCRMKKPEFCPDNVYDLMNKCWSEDPSFRPDFSALRRKLEELIETSAYVPYINCSLDTSGYHNPFSQ